MVISLASPRPAFLDIDPAGMLPHEFGHFTHGGTRRLLSRDFAYKFANFLNG